MAQIAGRRMTAEIDGDFVVFLIGPRFNDRLTCCAASWTSAAAEA
jgi:hypothetical protein